MAERQLEEAEKPCREWLAKAKEEGRQKVSEAEKRMWKLVMEAKEEGRERLKETETSMWRLVAEAKDKGREKVKEAENAIRGLVAKLFVGEGFSTQKIGASAASKVTQGSCAHQTDLSPSEPFSHAYVMTAHRTAL